MLIVARATLPRSLKRNSRVALRNAAGVDCLRVVRSVLCSLIIPLLSSRDLYLQVWLFGLKWQGRMFNRGELLQRSLQVDTQTGTFK